MDTWASQLDGYHSWGLPTRRVAGAVDPWASRIGMYQSWHAYHLKEAH